MKTKHGASGRFVVTHGHAGTAEHAIWGNMLYRCNTPTSHNYPRYGGRGITVCDRWKDFEAFIADMGLRPSPTHSIERRDNDGNYEPDNCRWATPMEQAQNRENTSRVGGLSPRQLSEETGLPLVTIKTRIRRGWSDERIVSQPHRFGLEAANAGG